MARPSPHHYVTIVATDQRLRCTCADRRHAAIVVVAGAVR